MPQNLRLSWSCHWNQKAKYPHPSSSSSKPCNPLIFPNVKQKLDWIINCPLLPRNPSNLPCFQLVLPPSCQVPPAAVKRGQSLQIPTHHTQQVRSASVMLKQLCWCPQNWISVPSSRNIPANLLCSSLLHYCTVPYSSFFFKPTCIGIFMSSSHVSHVLQVRTLKLYFRIIENITVGSSWV